MSEPIVIGSFGKTFGILGWIKVNSLTSPRKNILDFKPWLIKRKQSWEEICIAASREHSNNIIVKLPNYNSPEEAQSLVNAKIAIWQKQLPKLQLSEYYWTDLIDLKVINSQGFDLGTVQDLMSTGANDILVVFGNRKRLIPYISQAILKVDLPEKIIQVDWEQDWS